MSPELRGIAPAGLATPPPAAACIPPAAAPARSSPARSQQVSWYLYVQYRYLQVPVHVLGSRSRSFRDRVPYI